MATATQTLPPAGHTAKDPYFYGWREVSTVGEDGTQKWERIPLTEWDVLHPQEEDFIMQIGAHSRNCVYALQAIQDVLANRPGTLVLFDHRVDWQVPGIIPHGPDVVALSNLTAPWDLQRGTFPVKDMNATVLAVIEITSPSTRNVDFDEKVVEYHEAGIPYYILADTREIRGQSSLTVLGFEAHPAGYLRLRPDPTFGIWVPTLAMWFGAEGDFLVCYDKNKVRIPEHSALRQQATDAAARAEAEKARADAEKARADKAAATAAAAEARADDVARRNTELEAEIRRLRGEPPTSTAG